jgi:hypothetical protein
MMQVISFPRPFQEAAVCRRTVGKFRYDFFALPFQVLTFRESRLHEYWMGATDLELDLCEALERIEAVVNRRGGRRAAKPQYLSEIRSIIFGALAVASLALDERRRVGSRFAQ